MILTGGRSSRLGTDKAHAAVAGTPLFERVLAAVPPEVPVVVSGPLPVAQTGRQLAVVREDPPGGGPVAGIEAALTAVSTDVVVVLATDLPFLDGVPPALAAGLTARPGVDALVATDAAGRDQPLLAAYRTPALRSALERLGGTAGAPMRSVLALLTCARTPVGTIAPHATTDVDTPADLAAARAVAAAGADPALLWADDEPGGAR